MTQLSYKTATAAEKTAIDAIIADMSPATISSFGHDNMLKIIDLGLAAFDARSKFVNAVKTARDGLQSSRTGSAADVFKFVSQFKKQAVGEMKKNYATISSELKQQGKTIELYLAAGQEALARNLFSTPGEAYDLATNLARLEGSAAQAVIILKQLSALDTVISGSKDGLEKRSPGSF